MELTESIETTREKVREAIDIIKQCEEDNLPEVASMQVALFLRDKYGYDRAEATHIFVAAEVVMDLQLDI